MYREQQLRSLFQGRRILIAGYGREGRSSEHLIHRLLPEADITIADGNDNIHAELAKGYDMIIKSPGIPMREMQGARHITSQADLFLQVFHDRTIGVTGTKGKSTTTSLIHHLLCRAGRHSVLAGNIGIPLFDIIDGLDEHSIVTAELSCHQLEGISRAPHIGVLLNLYQEHLDHYDGYDGYKMAKMQMALRQQPGDHFFYCADEAEVCRMVERQPLPGTAHPYTLTGADLDLLRHVPLEGNHNLSNALVAVMVAREENKADFDIPRALASFQPLRHRLERVGEYAGITWYDDSISTIPEAAIAAVKALGSQVKTLILGGFDRGIDYSPLVEFLQEHPVENIVFVGQAGRRIQSQFTSTTFQYIIEDDYTKIVPWCAEHTPKGTVCLLSPAAASYDAFKNFEHRGDFYAEQIKKL